MLRLYRSGSLSWDGRCCRLRLWLRQRSCILNRVLSPRTIDSRRQRARWMTLLRSLRCCIWCPGSISNELFVSLDKVCWSRSIERTLNLFILVLRLFLSFNLTLIEVTANGFLGRGEFIESARESWAYFNRRWRAKAGSRTHWSVLLFSDSLWCCWSINFVRASLLTESSLVRRKLETTVLCRFFQRCLRLYIKVDALRWHIWVVRNRASRPWLGLIKQILCCLQEGLASFCADIETGYKICWIQFQFSLPLLNLNIHKLIVLEIFHDFILMAVAFHG